MEFLISTVLLVISLALFLFIKHKKKSTLPGPSQDQQISAQPTEVAVSKPAPQPVPVPAAPTLSKGMGKTAKFFQSALDKIFSDSQAETFYENLEEALLGADVGLDFTEKFIETLRAKIGFQIPKRAELTKLIEEIILSQLPAFPTHGFFSSASPLKSPHVVMIVGVNGAGKTTTVGKLCKLLRDQNKKVLVGAADTFRAAATEQLKQWVDRTGAEGVFQKEGADPGAVSFDTVQSAYSRLFDVCLIDTAGRLHTKQNLMDELTKVKRVMGKASTQANSTDLAPHDVWLVIDGTMGQNALMQAREFHKALGLTGIIITKLDSSSKGGVILSIVSELNVPVVMVGVGESAEDLLTFSREEFVRELLQAV